MPSKYKIAVDHLAVDSSVTKTVCNLAYINPQTK